MKIKSLTAKFALAIVLVFSLVSFATSPVFACTLDPYNPLGSGMDCGKVADNPTNIGEVITDVINVLLFIIGIVSVIMIIVGGIKYSTSVGDASKVTTAKNTIMYAVIGLVAAILAYAIVNFVVTNLSE